MIPKSIYKTPTHYSRHHCLRCPSPSTMSTDCAPDASGGDCSDGYPNASRRRNGDCHWPPTVAVAVGPTRRGPLDCAVAAAGTWLCNSTRPATRIAAARGSWTANCWADRCTWIVRLAGRHVVHRWWVDSGSPRS